MFLHLPNIRDARNAHDNVQLGSPDWRAEYIAAIDFYSVRMFACHSWPSTTRPSSRANGLLLTIIQVCSSDQADPVCNGQIQITAFGQGPNSGVHVETVIQTFLETQGEVFALLRQSDMGDGAFRALAEFADADVAIAVVHRFNGTTLGVRRQISVVRSRV